MLLKMTIKLTIRQWIVEKISTFTGKMSLSFQAIFSLTNIKVNLCHVISSFIALYIEQLIRLWIT